jgi:hypothetical protein
MTINAYSFTEWLVLALAVFRLVQLCVYDRLTESFRTRWMPASFIGYLLSCQWCIGIWLATIVVGSYLLFPWLFPLFLILSLAAASSLLHTWLDRSESNND